jgi:putative dehydrogenase
VRNTRHKPVFADCNAVNPETVQQIGAVIAAVGTPFVDGCIIGLPPIGGSPCPRIYVSGAAAGRLRELADYGLDVRVLDGPIGAASALKMCYAGINKGITTVVTAMLLAATRAGAAEALREEFAASDPQFLKSIYSRVTLMFPKAYRWVAEMQEIADFAGDDAATRKMYEGAAELYQRLANDLAGDKRETGALSEFVKAG